MTCKKNIFLELTKIDKRIDVDSHPRNGIKEIIELLRFSCFTKDFQMKTLSDSCGIRMVETH